MNQGLGGFTLSFSFFCKVAIQTPLAARLARNKQSKCLCIFSAHTHNGQVARVSVQPLQFAICILQELDKVLNRKQAGGAFLDGKFCLPETVIFRYLDI